MKKLEFSHFDYSIYADDRYVGTFESLEDAQAFIAETCKTEKIAVVPYPVLKYSIEMTRGVELMKDE